MKDWFEWNGVKSTEYGIAVLEQPPITLATERVTYTDVPGRSGSLTSLEGTDVYGDIVLAAECYIKDEERLNEIAGWLKGGGKVKFANRPNVIYEARINNQIPFEKIVRGKPNRTFSVNFRCKPFGYDVDNPIYTLTRSGNVTNRGNVIAEPVITVTGSGDITLMVNQDIIELSGISGSITVDSALMEAYKGTTAQNDKMSGEFPTLKPGTNGISWTGSVTKVEIKVNPRYR